MEGGIFWGGVWGWPWERFRTVPWVRGVLAVLRFFSFLLGASMILFLVSI